MGRFASFTATLALLVVAGCGGGGVGATPTFAQGVIGPAGGSMAAGAVSLVLPPGALAVDTVVRILAQPYPLPIDPLAPPITPMPGFMCIGPIGTTLGTPATVRFCFDPATIPVGSTEADVVLLEWDAVAGILRVSPTAVLDPVTHCYEDTVYGELGHIGVGAVTGAPSPDLVFASDPPVSMRAIPAVLPAETGLFVASSTGAVLPSVLPGTAGAAGYVASLDGTKVLWRSDDFQIQASFLFSSEISDGTLHTVLDSDEPFLPFDPMYGFLTSSRVYHAQDAFEADTSHDVLRDVGVTGTPAASDVYSGGAAFGSLVDVRVSPDETMVLLRYRQFSKGAFDSLFVIDAVTGAEIGTFLSGVDDPSDVTPRWLPDSSGLYFVDPSAQTVTRIPPDGTSPTVLYTMPASPNAFLQDFVVSPTFGTVPLASTPCAYVRGTFSFVIGAGLPVADASFFVRDVLGGGAAVSNSLGARFDVLELIYHPNGTKVIADIVEDTGIIVIDQGGRGGGEETVRIFDATTAAQLHVFVATLEQFDLSRSTGELVVWFPTGGIDPAFPAAGLFRLAANGDTLGAIDTNGNVPTGPARFLRSWRRTPGELASYIR